MAPEDAGAACSGAGAERATRGAARPGRGAGRIFKRLPICCRPVRGLFTKTNVAIILAVGLLAAILIAATTGGIGKDDVPSDDVVVVDGNGISNDDFSRAMDQAAKQQGRQAAPNPGDPQYETIRDAALGDLLDIAWIQGEAEDQGISVSDREVQQ